MLRFILATLVTTALVSGCTTIRETNPTQTAREQLLMSKAVDNAGAQIHPNLPAGNKIYVDTSDFGDNAEYNKTYAIGVIKTALLKRGYDLVAKPGDADTILNIRAGALSINEKNSLLGIPSITLPVPLSGPITTPEIGFWKSKHRRGVAKLGLTFYNAHSGTLEDAIGPIYGFSHYNTNSLLFVGWTNSDLLPSSSKDH